MANKKMSRRALFMSVMSLILCFAMLMGTTFAWFTDSVSSANNIIQSGNLDIELKYSKNMSADSWTTVENTTDLFDQTLWEPGHTQVVYLKLSNEGSLALKYQLEMNFTETPGTNVAGEQFNLSQYLKYDLVEVSSAFASRDLAREAVKGTAKTLATHTVSGQMLGKTETATESKTMALVVYMPEEVNNEANHKTGTQPPVINLGIILNATQLESEDDSFGPDYDGGAPWVSVACIDWYLEDPTAEEFVLTSAEDLAGFAAIVNGTATADMVTYTTESNPQIIQDSFAGKTVKLGNSIDLAGHEWVSIGNWDNTFEGTFDGQGNTISNLYINEPEGEGIGLFGVVKNATIKGIKIKNVNITGYSMVAGVVGAPYPANISDCHITGSVKIVADWAYVAGIAGYCYYGTQVDGCSAIADGTGLIKSNTRNAVGGITAWLLEGDHKVTNCQVKNLDLVGWANVGGITGFVAYSNTIDGCSVENVTLTKTRLDGIASIGLASGGYGYNNSAAITITDNTFNNITLNGNYMANAGAGILYGGEYYGKTTPNFELSNNTQENITNNLVEVSKPDATSLQTAVAQEGATVVVPAGTYTFPSTFAKGVTLICDGEVVFEGVSGMNINGATVIGATFDAADNTNDNTGAGTGTINGTFKDCTFTGNHGLRYCYAGETVVFENCVFDGDKRGIHFDGMDNNVYFKDCIINGFNAIGGNATITFEGCTFDKSNHSYNGLNLYCNTELIDCTYNFRSGKTNFIDMEGIGKTLTISNTKATLDGASANVASFIGGSKLTQNNVIIDGCDVAVNLNHLQAKLDAATDGTVITLAADITGDVTATQKPDVKITIDGDGHKFGGVLLVDGKSATYTTAGLTIKNVNFVADSISEDACIRLGDGTNATRYTCNVTVDNCTFDVPGAVGIKSYTGGDKKLTITGCTATAKAHSLVQAKGIDGILVENCKVYSKNGMNFNNSDNVTVSGCTADVNGYAVRFGESSGGTGAAETYLIKDSSLKSANDEGDAVIILRGTADNATLTIQNTTITGTPDITNTATGATVVR